MHLPKLPKTPFDFAVWISAGISLILLMVFIYYFLKDLKDNPKLKWLGAGVMLFGIIAFLMNTFNPMHLKDKALGSFEDKLASQLHM
jgi:ABC-type amino acid transport system permease subunit